MFMMNDEASHAQALLCVTRTDLPQKVAWDSQA